MVTAERVYAPVTDTQGNTITEDDVLNGYGEMSGLPGFPWWALILGSIATLGIAWTVGSGVSDRKLKKSSKVSTDTGLVIHVSAE